MKIKGRWSKAPFSSKLRFYSSKMRHALGHSSTQAPQSTQSFSLTTATSVTLMAELGQTSSQAPHPTHSSAFTLTTKRNTSLPSHSPFDMSSAALDDAPVLEPYVAVHEALSGEDRSRNILHDWITEENYLKMSRFLQVIDWVA